MKVQLQPKKKKDLQLQFTMPKKLHKSSSFLPTLSIKTIATIDPENYKNPSSQETECTSFR